MLHHGSAQLDEPDELGVDMRIKLERLKQSMLDMATVGATVISGYCGERRQWRSPGSSTSLP
jgi:hypothetical protein